MTNPGLNPLPIIKAWLSEHNYHDQSDMPRQQLEMWLAQRYNMPANDPFVTVAIDCLIAAGIGREAEQSQTVLCSVRLFQ